MNRTALGAIVGLLAIVAAAAWSIAGPDRKLGVRAESERPSLLLLTSLPLVFAEGFDVSGGGSPTLTRLEQRYKVLPINVADAATLQGHKLLLMAHPRAQPAEVLVELDQWVREGGHLLLLADPRLDWPSERPLGDMLRPPPSFADTGLLAHWGLRLMGPESGGARPAGKLVSNGSCKTDDDGLMARCKLGEGQATIIADADFLNVEASDSDNLDLLMVEPERLGQEATRPHRATYRKLSRD